MKQIFILLVSVFALSSCSEAQVSSSNTSSTSSSEAVEQPKVINKVVGADEFARLMEQEGIQLVDVRTPGEYSGGKIGEAVNIDFMSSDFQEKMSALDKTKPTLIYCASGNRSGRASKVMQSMGFTEIYDLQGGYGRWPR